MRIHINKELTKEEKKHLEEKLNEMWNLLNQLTEIQKLYYVRREPKAKVTKKSKGIDQ